MGNYPFYRDVMEIFSPRTRFKSVDFPTLGAPTMATNPDLKPAGYGVVSEFIFSPDCLRLTPRSQFFILTEENKKYTSTRLSKKFKLNIRRSQGRHNLSFQHNRLQMFMGIWLCTLVQLGDLPGQRASVLQPHKTRR